MKEKTATRIKHDISGTDDVVTLVNAFYNRVRRDPELGPIFDDIAKVNWSLHLPRMYEFWNSLLLSTHTYKGNPMVKHILLDSKAKLSPQHFEQWFTHWVNTVDDLFAGPIANLAKEKADNIRTLMSFKVSQSRNSGFIQ